MPNRWTKRCAQGASPQQSAHSRLSSPTAGVIISPIVILSAIGGVPMTPLRQRMLETMQLRGLALRTQESYLSAVRLRACHCGKSPDLITEDELRQYFLFLIADKQLAPTTTTVALNAIKFFYLYPLGRPWPLRDLV